jgi:hypothetical protein
MVESHGVGLRADRSALSGRVGSVRACGSDRVSQGRVGLGHMGRLTRLLAG